MRESDDPDSPLPLKRGACDGLLRADSDFFGFFYLIVWLRVKEAGGPDPRWVH